MTSFDASITGDELTMQLPNFRSVVALHAAYMMLFMHRITSVKRTCEVRPVVLVGGSSTQLLMYLLDTDVRYSIQLYLPIFKYQKGSIEALNFLIITS